MYSNIHCICQVYELNKKISVASKDRNSPLFNVPLVVDPSNEIAEVLVEALEWNMMSREWNVTVSDLQELHRKSMSLLELLKTHLPDRVGGAQGWNFEKAHSILYFLRIGCALSISAGHDEPGRFASACGGEVPLLQIYFSITMYML